ncbi:MAG: DUF4465 domain-containing protein [Myxococcota bacterium]
MHRPARFRLRCLLEPTTRLGLLLLVVCARPALAGPYTDAGHPAIDMSAWGDTLVELIRGPLDIANPAAGNASFGEPDAATGPAAANALDAVSLGDGGSATLHFPDGIHNGPGDDLAVFENGFGFLGGLFAELAFVEVGTNGLDFARFPATTLAPLPVASFDPIDPTDYHGLAGRHSLGFGTGFDLEALAADPLVQSGAVDLLDIRYVRVVDVIGDGSFVDDEGQPIYDPYPTAFAAGGFDLEAVGALYVFEPGLAHGLLAGGGGLALAGAGRRPGARRRARRARRSGARRPGGWPAALAGRLRTRLRLGLAAIGMASLFTLPAAALTATFDDLGLGAESVLDGSTLAGGFTSGGVFFENTYEPTFGSFSGFAASSTTDTTTPGFGNQFSNITGTGQGGSAGFGIGYFDARLELPTTEIVQGAWFTNTTYAALAMREGDAFSKRFGGATGSDPDYFKLIVEGIDALGGSTGIAELFLADFRFADPAADYILDEWVFLDLSGLGAVRALRFGFESSDVGAFGINTPVYFAIDDLTTIPEPGHALLIGLGLALLARRPRDAR